ncbi:hypothetical protein QFC20_005040 [Naganishia adeliensis]|uniref:Uncharacterized protein n=1 Tax=Naganishia adeliensis TaxID=92952 RepID=A0ACC2VTV8_9TREE|nr:hypothetical protein QFC20_005040 [Naganishia adeliensis]
MSTAPTQQSGTTTPAEPVTPQPTSPVDVYSLEAPAGIEQPYLSRMVPLTTRADEHANDVAKRSVGAYGFGWSMVQGPPSLFAAGSPWIGWRQ